MKIAYALVPVAMTLPLWLGGCATGNVTDPTDMSPPTITIDLEDANGVVIPATGPNASPLGAVVPANGKVIYAVQASCISGVECVKLAIQSFTPVTSSINEPSGTTQTNAMTSWSVVGSVNAIMPNQVIWATASVTDYHGHTVTSRKLFAVTSAPSITFTNPTVYFLAGSGIQTLPVSVNSSGTSGPTPFTLAAKPIGGAPADGVAAENVQFTALPSVPVQSIGAGVAMKQGSQGGAYLITASSVIAGIPTSGSCLLYEVGPVQQNAFGHYTVTDCYVSAIIPGTTASSPVSYVLTIVGGAFDKNATEIYLVAGDYSSTNPNYANAWENPASIPNVIEINQPFDNSSPNKGFPSMENPNQVWSTGNGTPGSMINLLLSSSTMPLAPQTPYTVWVHSSDPGDGAVGCKFIYQAPP